MNVFLGKNSFLSLLLGLIKTQFYYFCTIWSKIDVEWKL